MKYLSILTLIAALVGCASTTAQPAMPVVAPPAQTTPATQPSNAVVTVTDGSKGAIVRDASGLSGGTRGYVNSALYNHTVTGIEEDAFEWSHLSVLDNFAKRGENVASYAQGNKLGTGPTWAAVSEATDTTGYAGGLIAHEFDTFTTGPDNGQRIGLDIASGDARSVRGMGRSQQADASVAIRVGQTVTTPWATWGTGLEMQGNFRDSAIRIRAPDGHIVFEIRPNGDVYKNGVKVL
jgi:hypothetical protein